MRAELVVDAANVVGSRPDGWWRDRPGAAARLVTGLTAALRSGALTGPVAVILEGAARSGVPATPIAAREVPGGGEVDAGGGEMPGLRVLHAPADGDSAIVAEVTALVDAGTEVTVVTADRGLRARVIATGAQVVGPSWLRDRLP